MVALAKASSSHARSRRSSPADAVEADAEKEEVEAVPEELVVKADVEDTSQLLLDSVSEAARVRVSEGRHGSAAVGGAGVAGEGRFFFFLAFFLDGFMAPTAVVASSLIFPLSGLRRGGSPPLRNGREFFFAASATRRGTAGKRDPIWISRGQCQVGLARTRGPTCQWRFLVEGTEWVVGGEAGVGKGISGLDFCCESCTKLI
jgi:hypothetical protein